MKKFSLFLATLALFFTTQVALAAFPDVNSQTDYEEGILWTVDEGITKGYNNGLWGPNDCVLRSELSKMLLEYRFGDRANDLAFELESWEDFPDVLASDWHYNYIRYARFLEIVEGYPNGFFVPNDCVKRVEAMKMAVNTLLPGEEIESSDHLTYWGDHGPIMIDMEKLAWYAPYARVLFENGLVGTKHTSQAQVEEGGNQNYLNFFPADSMSRKEVAEMLFRIDEYKGLGIEKEYRIDYIQGDQGPYDQRPSLVEIDKKSGEEVVLVEDMRETYEGGYFRIIRQPIEDSTHIILQVLNPESDGPSEGEILKLNPSNLELKSLKINELSSYNNHSISPDGKKMAWIIVNHPLDEQKAVNKIYLVDLINDQYSTLTEVSQGEILGSHFEWLNNEMIKYAVDDDSDNRDFIEYRSVSIGNPIESNYYSTASNKSFDYFYIEPLSPLPPDGLFIYLHGAGGGYEQGMSDTNYFGNFKNLKDHLKEENFVYATPATSGFGESGGADVVEFMRHMKAEYGDLPIYLSGASAGGSTLFHTLNEYEPLMGGTGLNIQGAAFIVPSVSTNMIDEMDWFTKNISVWIEAGENDGVFPPDRVTYFENALAEDGHTVESNIIEKGDHNAPVERANWVNILDFLRNGE